MTYQTITTETEPVLLPWLRETLKGCAVMDTEISTLDHTGGLHVIEVNNGYGGHSGAGAYIAWTTDPKIAELLAAGLWALLEKHQESPRLDEVRERLRRPPAWGPNEQGHFMVDMTVEAYERDLDLLVEAARKEDA